MPGAAAPGVPCSRADYNLAALCLLAALRWLDMGWAGQASCAKLTRLGWLGGWQGETTENKQNQVSLVVKRYRAENQKKCQIKTKKMPKINPGPCSAVRLFGVEDTKCSALFGVFVFGSVRVWLNGEQTSFVECQC